MGVEVVADGMGVRIEDSPLAIKGESSGGGNWGTVSCFGSRAEGEVKEEAAKSSLRGGEHVGDWEGEERPVWRMRLEGRV